MMALAVSAQAVILPLTYSLPYTAPIYSPLSYTARSLPLTYAAAPLPLQYDYQYAPAIRTIPDINQYYAAAELRSPAAIIPVAAEG